MSAAPEHLATIRAMGRDWDFPIFSTVRGACKEPEGRDAHYAYCARARNNVLFLGDLPPLEAWRAVACQPRWNYFGRGEPEWRMNDASYQLVGERRFWGPRHHIRIWNAPDASYALGQAHHEVWTGIFRRHHEVTSVSAGMAAVAASLRGVPQCRINLRGLSVLVVGADHARVRGEARHIRD